MQVDEALHARELLPYAGGLAAQHAQLVAEDADDEPLSRAGDRLVDPLAEVGLQVVEEAGHPRLQRAQLLGRPVVVGARREADPGLREVRPDDLLAQARLPDVRAVMRDSLDSEDLAACLRHDSPGLVDRVAGNADPVQ